MKKAFIAVFVIGSLLRLLTVAAAINDERYNPYNRVDGDTASYIAIAISLIRGEGYSDHYEASMRDFFKDPERDRGISPTPTYKKPPGYPLFLAAVFYIFGLRLEPVIFIQMILSALSILIVYAIGKEISSPRVALIASALTSFYYQFWYRAATIMVETLLIFLTLLFFYYFVLWFKTMSVSKALSAGILAGAAFLVRPIILPAIPLFLLASFLAIKKSDIKSFISGAAAIIFGVLLVISPFAVRNYHHTGQFLVTPTFGGYQFLLLYNPHNIGSPIYTMDPGFMTEDYPGFEKYTKEDLRVDLPCSVSPVMRECVQDKIYGETALRFILSNPGHFFKMLPRTFWNMWRFDYPDSRLYDKSDNLRSLPGWAAFLFFKANNFVLYVCMIPFVILGLYATARRREILPFLVSVFFCYFVIFHILIATNMRHRLTIMPFFFILAAIGIDRISIRLKVAALK